MRKQIMLWTLLILACLLGGCRGQSEEEESGYKIWYMNQEETALEYEYRQLQASKPEELAGALLGALRELPEGEGRKPVLPEAVKAEHYELEQDQLYLDFTPEYLSMPKVYEVLCRAAVVRTLCQVPEVEYVGFRVGGQPLMDLSGEAVGLMNEEQFIENAGEEINTYKTAELTLYYTNETGDRLVKQQVVTDYNSNISLEKLIVEHLIAGPPLAGAYPTIPEGTKLVGVAVRDEICYVNLSEEFLKPGYNVTESVPIYSIVNSLIENTGVQKVQISIDGETNLSFRENISFDTIFEKNEELIE